MSDLVEKLDAMTAKSGTSHYTGEEFVHGFRSQEVVDALRQASTEIRSLRTALAATEWIKPREIMAMAHLIGVLADDMTESNWADKRLYIKQQAKRIRARAEALGLTALTAAEGVKPRVKPLAQCECCDTEISEDVNVPDGLWAQISPRPVDGFKSGGLLCPQCIVDRLSALQEGE